MDVAAHRLSVSKLSVMVSPDIPHYGFAHGGPLIVPPGRLHILATSPRPLPPLPPSSGCSSCCEGCLTYTVQPAWPAFPSLRPVRVRLFRVLLGQRPSLHDLLPPSPACVR